MSGHFYKVCLFNRNEIGTQKRQKGQKGQEILPILPFLPSLCSTLPYDLKPNFENVSRHQQPRR